MHYDPRQGYPGLERDPFKSIVAPRPVGWISTIGADGVCNLAPYSFFNAVSEDPHYVMFSSMGVKDSVRNIRETGEFVCSLATWELRHAVNVSSAALPPGVDEFRISGLTAAPSRFVEPPRVRESPAALECRHFQTIELPSTGKTPANHLVIGEVVGIYIDDSVIHHGRVATGDLVPIARLGGADYAVVRPEAIFKQGRPVVEKDGRVSIKGG